MADLGTFLNDEYQPDTPFDVELHDTNDVPLFNNDGTPMTISVLGEDSAAAVAARYAQGNRQIHAGPRSKITAEGIDATGAAYLAKLCTSWNITMGGEKPPFSHDAAKALFANPKARFIRDQVDRAVADRANFTRKAPKA